MSSRPLNDDEVLTEMNKMVAFIKQEALEKAREIKVKADEEFAIEKAKLVRQESQAIDATYEKKRKGAEVAQKISQSTQTNRSRLRILQAREELLQDLFSTARSQIMSLSQEEGRYSQLLEGRYSQLLEGRYSQLLEGSILQGALQMLEPEITVHTRKKDVEIAERAAESAERQYTDLSGFKLAVTVRGTLSDESPGGVNIISGNGRITINNTLDERLRLLEDRMLPEIRRDLFGTNENRKFYN